MAFGNPYQTYQKQAVTTSKPEELTYMLYQGLVKFIRLAKISIQNKKLPESHHYNIKAQDILTELMATLNKDYDVADSLFPLYDYMKRRLIEANMKKNVEILEEVEGFAKELSETWAAAMKLSTKG
ncbi:flagellar export chaperone FliS [Neobacillus fumarioli]|uniref:flagellar export chaperone FliS n=1 Tax=Neobacillus fumarioli TaxID=105229 RepID=UPI0008349ED9|nr:flagellar export chaperone FliS [Neobacillus fumarioli]